MRKLPNGTRVKIDNGGSVRFGTISRYDAKSGAYVIEPEGRQLGEPHLVVKAGAHHLITPTQQP